MVRNNCWVNFPKGITFEQNGRHSGVARPAYVDLRIISDKNTFRNRDPQSFGSANEYPGIGLSELLLLGNESNIDEQVQTGFGQLGALRFGGAVCDNSQLITTPAKLPQDVRSA